MRLIVITCLALTMSAPTAAAASGNGLYKPYPAVNGLGTAQAYYAQLGLTPTASQLSRGDFSGGLAASSVSGPSHRAGAAGASLGLTALLAVAVLGLVAAAGVALSSRRAARAEIG